MTATTTLRLFPGSTHAYTIANQALSLPVYILFVAFGPRQPDQQNYCKHQPTSRPGVDECSYVSLFRKSTIDVNDLSCRHRRHSLDCCEA
ncbi:hypothetical protein BDN72DRAFT_85539 [Pluteus cervinus]|uniref:Uncharacterized protein n=1 Tax=Pluteus cervinus TaxID=181527 RepID=A0ACD3AQC5_9AGAR|nr:hypothetical protein BDN72DRAFT_85539 [Pluteus cervinus]